MAHIISITSLKGGVGKTTTAINLAASFAILEKKTLIIDCDPQGNVATGLGIEKSSISKDISDLLTNKKDIGETIYDTSFNYLKCIPAANTLADVEKFIEKKSFANAEKILADKIGMLGNIYDYIIIDTPSSVGFLIKSALTASKWVIIPLTYHFYTIERLRHTIMRIKEIKNTLNPSLSIAGLLLTMYDKRDYISDKFSKNIFADFNKLILKTIILYDLQLHEAVGCGKPIALYDIMAKSAKSHLELADEIKEIINQNKKASNANVG